MAEFRFPAQESVAPASYYMGRVVDKSGTTGWEGQSKKKIEYGNPAFLGKLFSLIVALIILLAGVKVFYDGIREGPNNIDPAALTRNHFVAAVFCNPCTNAQSGELEKIAGKDNVFGETSTKQGHAFIAKLTNLQAQELKRKRWVRYIAVLN